MCGLCGVAGPGLKKWDVDNFRELLYVSALRGQQGTGVARINSNNDRSVTISKSVYDASYFINMDNARKHPIIESSLTALYMGHCRSPTKGAITQDNCHPFDTGRYVSAHNGTLVDKAFTDAKKTDSEMMFTEMEKSGVKNTLGGLSFSSAFAVSIWDKRSKKLILGRNSQRTLYGVFLKNRDVFYWASEAEMLRLILARNHESRNDITYLQPDTLYSINPMSIDRTKEYNNWDIETIGRESRWPLDDTDWAEVISKTESEISTAVSSITPKVTSTPKLIYGPESKIEPEHIPEFLRTPKKHEASIASEYDLCFRCKKPLNENEAFTCRECKTTAYAAVGKKTDTHDVQSTDERAA